MSHYSAADKAKMSSHIVPFPSLSHSLSSLQYATDINNVPIYQGNSRSTESEEKVRVAVFSDS